MKRHFPAFFRFSRMERLGIAALSLLLTALTGLMASMDLWVVPSLDGQTDRLMAVSYAAWRVREAADRPAAAAAAETAPPELFPFDPNSLDSAGFIRLGMPPRAVKGLMAWRRKGKRFRRPDDLKPLYNLPETVYARLSPFIRIQEHADQYAQKNYDMPAIPAVIELNSADSALLDRGIRGIGATLARKIVARREALGGYISHEQLLEIYRFPDSTFSHIKERVRIDGARVRKLGLNVATAAQLAAHPYIGEAVAKNILLYRDGLGRFSQVAELRQVPLMSEEIYRKIAPYFTVD